MQRQVGTGRHRWGCGEQRRGSRAGGSGTMISCTRGQGHPVSLPGQHPVLRLRWLATGSRRSFTGSSGPCQGKACVGGGEETQVLGLEEVTTIRYQ